MAKSRDAFRTISEVSDWLDTPAHVLRFWESKFNQIKPVKRAGGRRYYRPDDMALLSGIKMLLHEQGMTIKGVQKLLRENGVKHVIEIGLASPDHETGGAVIDVAAEPVPVEGREPVPQPDMLDPVPDDMPVDMPGDPAPHIEPAAWDADDPWPADPAPIEREVFDEVAEAPAPVDDTVIEDPAEPAEAAPLMPPPPRREVSLPFVRARAEGSTPPDPTPEAEILEFAQTPRPPIPDMPDEDAHHGHPGAMTALIGADAGAIRRNASQIMPLVARLKVVSDRMANRP